MSTVRVLSPNKIPSYEILFGPIIGGQGYVPKRFLMKINKKYGLESFDEVIEDTKGWRKSIGLPYNYLVLSDDGTSTFLLKTENKQNASVIWCILEDVGNLCDKEHMEYNPTIFPTFADFFKFLLDKEEEHRTEGLQ